MYRFLEQTVSGNMASDVVTVTRDVSVRELGKLFEKHDFNVFPVQEDEYVTGLVSKFDYLSCFVFTPAHMIPRYQELMERTVADVMTSDFIYVGKETKLTRVLQLMVDHRIRSMPVLKTDRRLAGMISREDVMRALARCTDEARGSASEGLSTTGG